jgi:thioredoxin 1
MPTGSTFILGTHFASYVTGTFMKEYEMAKDTSDSVFEQDVLASTKRVLVDFWASWCGPCRALLPIVEKITEKAQGKVDIFKLDVDANPLIPSRYGVTAIPTVIIFNRGRIEREFVGVQSEETYYKALALE